MSIILSTSKTKGQSSHLKIIFDPLLKIRSRRHVGVAPCWGRAYYVSLTTDQQICFKWLDCPFVFDVDKIVDTLYTGLRLTLTSFYDPLMATAVRHRKEVINAIIKRLLMP